jgi:hypothetical protein
VRSAHPFIALTALALAACAEGGWRKAGADAETLKGDLGACQSLAYDKVSRQAPAAPPVALDNRFGGHADGPIRRTDSRIREQQLVDGCMREKGYSFEPVPR